MKGNYKDGDLDGLWVWYRMDGQLLEKGPYKDSLREGFWVFSKRDGTTDMDGKCCGWHKGSGTYRKGKKVGD
jgi:antitoxin component YwqK of YwqJK toxin-antitoxin module